MNAFSNKMVGTSISIESSEKLAYPSISICRYSENVLDEEELRPSDRAPDLPTLLSSVDYNFTYQGTNSVVDLVNRDIYFFDTYTLIFM